jgi:hypothetical protein
MLKSITGVYIRGNRTPRGCAIIYVIFFLCVLFLMGGLFCGRGVGPGS